MEDDARLGRILEDLVETLEDSRQGYDNAADQLAENGYHEIANELREFSSQRARFSSELRDLAVSRGFVIAPSGSMAGLLHRRWLSLREAFGSDKAASVLSTASDGEVRAQEEYDKALREALPDGIRTVVARQAAEVTAAHDRLLDLGHSSLA